jgi:hypothetical protein
MKWVEEFGSCCALDFCVGGIRYITCSQEFPDSYDLTINGVGFNLKYSFIVTFMRRFRLTKCFGWWMSSVGC